MMVNDAYIKDYGKVLREKFPELFTARCEIGLPAGWFPLVFGLCSYIDAYVKRYNKAYDAKASVSVIQIKEKFGTLRFYTRENGFKADDGHDATSGDDTRKRIDMAIAFAEYTSGVICQNDGKLGKLRDGDWLITLCDDCAMIKEKQ